MIERKHCDLSIVRQCGLVGISRSSFYYRARPVSEENLALMVEIDRCYTAHPFYGARRIAKWLNERDWSVGRRRVGRLMNLMGLEAICPRPNTSRPAPGHKVYPYLLRGLVIDRPNQVWATDITYIPMAKGFVYLVAIMDWYSRLVLSWRVSNTLHADFCVEALEEALARHGRPEIFNSDQGSQFTSTDFVEVLDAAGVRISMDGKGRYLDNIFVERLWRSLKYEEVYLKAYASVSEAKAGIGDWVTFYNEERFHQSLDYQTPRQVFVGQHGPWKCGRSAARNGSASPTSRQGPESGEMLAFDHIPTGPTTTEGFNNDVGEGKIAPTNTVPSGATVTIKDEKLPGTLS